MTGNIAWFKVLSLLVMARKMMLQASGKKKEKEPTLADRNSTVPKGVRGLITAAPCLEQDRNKRGSWPSLH
ncbi:hypothetical protein NDU88_005467 [Pleurodeles waltl]|uniref:Secreted protein n=1 Tax=Pleurodeles waltl TaxID=8319 RepID=A0AAV7UI53_PLEWA|nr:hypothetical protein NDU88_005467 [Pleurodeles waltl]